LPGLVADDYIAVVPRIDNRPVADDLPIRQPDVLHQDLNFRMVDYGPAGKNFPACITQSIDSATRQFAAIHSMLTSISYTLADRMSGSASSGLFATLMPHDHPYRSRPDPPAPDP